MRVMGDYTDPEWRESKSDFGKDFIKLLHEMAWVSFKASGQYEKVEREVEESQGIFGPYRKRVRSPPF